jgi:CheY-like chemotaxis protein
MTTKTKFQVISQADVSKDDVEVMSRGRVVMVVDDEKIIADTLSIILSREGFSTVTAYDGISALNLAKLHRPQLMISDVMMPKMTGVELAIAVTEMLPDCRILLFSGQAATVDLLYEARQAGYSFTTLTKPVHPTDMLRRVKTYFQGELSGQATSKSRMI